MKVVIATSREVGERCKVWAKSNTPVGFELTDNIDEAEILISVLYEKLVTAQFISSKKQCFNFHPGTLPSYRGAGCFSWSIINEERTAGITLHIMDSGIDSGDVIEIRSFPIAETDTAKTLFERGEKTIFDMFTQWYPKLLAGEYKAVKQDLNGSKIYYRKDLDKVKDLTRFVRALHFPGKESCYYFNNEGKKIYITYA